MCADSLENNQSQGICFLISKHSCRPHKELFLYLFSRQEDANETKHLVDDGEELVLLNLDQVLHLVLVLGIQTELLDACSVTAGPAE